jgi:hypothetical protein
MLPSLLSLSKLCPEAPLSWSKGVPKGGRHDRFCVRPNGVERTMV